MWCVLCGVSGVVVLGCRGVGSSIELALARDGM